MNGKHENRVLGRVLAVEEIATVAGAKPTSPCWDHITTVQADTSISVDCTQTQADSGTLADNGTSVIFDQISGA
ncbi:MAG: hypothetical protein ABL934_14805 [Lysobacteraceae bacterium]